MYVYDMHMYECTYMYMYLHIFINTYIYQIVLVSETKVEFTCQNLSHALNKSLQKKCMHTKTLNLSLSLSVSLSYTHTRTRTHTHAYICIINTYTNVLGYA